MSSIYEKKTFEQSHLEIFSVIFQVPPYNHANDRAQEDFVFCYHSLLQSMSFLAISYLNCISTMQHTEQIDTSTCYVYHLP